MQIEKLSARELKELQSRIIEQLAVRREHDLLELRVSIHKRIEDAGYTFDEVFGVKPARGKSPSLKTSSKGEPRYANPNDPKQTWTGHGKKPSWFKRAIEYGVTEDQLLIG